MSQEKKSGEIFGHPKGLLTLFGTEMFERFNFYGMRALMVLFLTQALLFDKARASAWYGTYTSVCYLTPLLGGYLADKYLGTRMAIILGGLGMAIGQFTLFVSATFFSETEFSTMVFAVGLGIIAFANGFFKPNISVQVADIYPKNDPRVSDAFNIFYMGINLGALLGPLIAGYFGESGNPADYKWGFAVSGIGMILGTVMFFIMHPINLRTPEGELIGMKPTKGSAKDLANNAPLTKIDIHRIAAIFIFSFFVIFFWVCFEQAGVSLTFLVEEQVNPDFAGITVRTSWTQSINPIFILLFIPLLTFFWTYLRKKNMEPSAPLKMAIGLMLQAVGFLVIALVIKGINPETKINMMWIFVMYAFFTLGEICLSPVGLSVVRKLAPLKFASLMFGVWFLANSSAYKIGGWISSYYPDITKVQMKKDIPTHEYLNAYFSNDYKYIKLTSTQGIVYLNTAKGDTAFVGEQPNIILDSINNISAVPEYKRRMISKTKQAEYQMDEFYSTDGKLGLIVKKPNNKQEKLSMEIWNTMPDPPTMFWGMLVVDSLYTFLMIFVIISASGGVLMFFIYKFINYLMHEDL